MKDNNKGFTLIEMAIVLVIIGLILGAVTKGRDILDSAKQKNFYSIFLKGWDLSVTSYYDRTHMILGSTPGTFASSSSYQMDNVITNLEAVGLEAPVTNGATANVMNYSGQDVTLTFRTDSNNKNYFRLTPIPVSLAIAIDTMVDGEMDGTTGQFLGDGNKDTGAAWTELTTATQDATTTARYYINFP